MNARGCLKRYFFEENPDEVELFMQGKGVVPESMLDFLERNDWFNGSGYLKEYIWEYITRNHLTDEQLNRLRRVALSYLNERVGREFWDMCRKIRLIADESFWKSVEEKRNSQIPKVRARAFVLLKYRDGNNSHLTHRHMITAVRKLWDGGQLP